MIAHSLGDPKFPLTSRFLLPIVGAPMPILQASIKDARQSLERRARKQPFKTRMKTEMRRVQDLVKAGKNEDAAKALPMAFKAIDTAAKKQIIHPKNAAHKKSSLAKSLVKKV
jgi:small subunit ribosomal protein S20